MGSGRAFFNQVGRFAGGLLGGWNINYTVSDQTGVPLGVWTGWEYTCGNPSKNARDETK